MRFLVPWGLVGLIPALAVLALSLRKGRPLLGRALTLTLLALAFAQPEVSLRRSEETIFLLLDRSASVGEEAEAALEELRTALAGRGARVGVVSFGGSPQVDRWPGPGMPGAAASLAQVERYATDIGAAVDLALALAPSGPTQLVLVSDGRATHGDALAAAARARARGIPISAFPVSRADLLRVADLSGPRDAPLGTVTLEAMIEASYPVTATAALFRGTELVQSDQVQIEPGRTRVAFADRPPAPGIHVYRLEVVVPEDPVPENNALTWAVTVGEAPAVLVVGQGESAVDQLLAAAGVAFARRDFLSCEDLGDVRLVILDDYPLGLIGERALAGLRVYVAGGGGLLVIQGRRAVAGYVGPVEELLPVTYAVPERLEEATAAVLFVLDRSSSMAGRSQGMAKIDLLKEAAAAAVEVMPPEDIVGALAFDRFVHWLVRPAPVAEAAEPLFQALRGLSPSGGTDVYPAMEEALSTLAEVPARIRHIIVISDGKTLREDRDFPILYRKVAESGIGVSAIGIGRDSDVEVMAGLAQAGHGQFLLLADIQDLRPVLVQETERVVRPRFVERETSVLPGPAARTLPLAEALPPLSGYTLTFPKPTAEVGLITPAGDPLVATWRIGLGQVAVINTDLAGVWSQGWLSSPALGRLWGALVGGLWTGRRPVRVDWKVDGSSLKLAVEVEEGGRWVNGLSLSGELVSGGERRTLVFSQVAPGRYEAELPVPAPGAHLLAVSEPSGRYGGAFPVALPYPEELAAFGADLDALRQIARVSGGTIIADELLPPPPGTGQDWLPLGRALLWGAAGTLLLDLALRKLVR
ncbi:MAG: VWA domain-containing protein [Candidatus Acetothermia bacterium]|jgi:Mg-chelatase subunit ChlD|nr:VWA domain-containing protein [Candidatus Acetothermia bacterium]